MSDAHRESESPLDRAIDVVAREMTNVEAPAGMRAEVLARIESASPRGASTLLPRWAMAASLAVIVLAVAAIVWFARPTARPESVTARHESSPAQTTVRSKPESRPAQTTPGATAAAGAASGSRTGEGTGSAGGGPPSPAATAGQAAPASQADQNATEAVETGPAALAPLEPIGIAALGPDALHIPSIGVEPLEELKPITIKDISVGSTEIQRRQDR